MTASRPGWHSTILCVVCRKPPSRLAMYKPLPNDEKCRGHMEDYFDPYLPSVPSMGVTEAKLLPHDVYVAVRR